ncbi:MAG: hypothetical protein K6G54_01475, partial [Oscillospiraceae bacterium]|nr:hypothetical protein [Oscillospiraceae bacterium]
MEKKKHPHTAGKKKRAAVLSAVALLTAASVTAGSLFATPAALLSDDGGVGSGYSVSVSGDGVDDDDAGVEQDESGETKKRGGVRAA